MPRPPRGARAASSGTEGVTRSLLCSRGPGRLLFEGTDQAGRRDPRRRGRIEINAAQAARPKRQHPGDRSAARWPKGHSPRRERQRLTTTTRLAGSTVTLCMFRSNWKPPTSWVGTHRRALGPPRDRCRSSPAPSGRRVESAPHRFARLVQGHAAAEKHRQPSRHSDSCLVLATKLFAEEQNNRMGQCSGMTPERRLPVHVEPILVGSDVFGKTESAGQRGVGEEGDLVDLAAAQGQHHHAPGLRAQVAAEGRLAVGAGRAYL